MASIPTPPTQKFLFDRSFDGPLGADAAKAQAAPTYTQEQIDSAKDEARAKGFAEGQAAMAAAQEAKLQTLLAQLERGLARLVEDANKQRHEQQIEISEIAVAIARKILPDYVQQFGVQEIQALVLRAVTEMSREPRLVLRVHDSMLDHMTTKIAPLSQQAAYNGKIVILADESLAPSDCKIEWADGGIERNSTLIWQEIDRAVSRAKTAEHSNTAPPAPQPTDSTTIVAV